MNLLVTSPAVAQARQGLEEKWPEDHSKALQAISPSDMWLKEEAETLL